MTKPLQTLTLLAAILVLPGLAVAQDDAATAPLSDPERMALTPARSMIELGSDVASKACAECHGMDGVSTESGRPSLAGQRTVYLHRVLLAYQARTRHSDPMNHAIGFLNEEALLAVSAYYANLTPQAPEPPSEGLAPVDVGDPFFAIREPMKKCVKCHGKEGNSSASGMPNLTAQDPKYFTASLQAYADGDRNHKLMSKLVSDMDEQTIAKMAVFYAVQAPTRTETVGDGNIDAGRAASEKCAACHGADGNASGADMPTLAGQDARYFVKALTAYKDGNRKHDQMFEAVGELSDADMANLATFYASQEPARRNVRTPLTTTEWIDRCERCHGIDGNSTDPRFPMLAGQDEAYLVTALQAYAGNARNNSVMHAMSEPLTEADIANIARHYATRTPKSVVYMQLPCEDTVKQ
jgi:cytochrome c553